MKKLSVLLLVCMSVTIAVTAQFRKVPAEVTNAFSAAYPTATNVSWKDNVTNFTAEFDLSGDHTESKFTKKGEWIQTVRDYKFDNLSGSVKDGFHKSKYNDWEVKEIKEIKEKGKDVTYRILAAKTETIQKRYLFFSEKGQLTRDSITL